MSTPIILYRLRLGFLLGHRFLVLVHRGKRTGRIRHTVLEVLRYDQAKREAVVVSGWGRRAAWFHNITSEPALQVWIAGERYRPSQRILSTDEAIATLEEYAQTHRPVRWIAPRIGFPLATAAGRQAIAADCPLVAFRALAT